MWLCWLLQELLFGTGRMLRNQEEHQRTDDGIEGPSVDSFPLLKSATANDAFSPLLTAQIQPRASADALPAPHQ